MDSLYYFMTFYRPKPWSLTENITSKLINDESFKSLKIFGSSDSKRLKFYSRKYVYLKKKSLVKEKAFFFLCDHEVFYELWSCFCINFKVQGFLCFESVLNIKAA